MPVLGIWMPESLADPVKLLVRRRISGSFRCRKYFRHSIVSGYQQALFLPDPDRFDIPNFAVEPEAAFFSGKAEEFILPYDRVRAAASPEASLTRFLQSAYEAAAGLGRWDRAALERHPHERP